jgi:hypothetical protein
MKLVKKRSHSKLGLEFKQKYTSLRKLFNLVKLTTLAGAILPFVIAEASKIVVIEDDWSKDLSKKKNDLLPL